MNDSFYMPLHNGKRSGKEILQLVCEIGMPAQLIGCEYIRSAVMLMLDDIQYSTSITRKLYPEIAKLYEMSEASVERSIRNAIERTWDRCSRDTLEKYFGSLAEPQRKRPTNTEFLIRLRDLTMLRMMEKTEE